MVARVRGERVKRGAIELVVIVVGVLIALAADRAFLAIDAAATDREHVAALIADLSRDSTAIARSLAWSDSTLVRSGYALGIARGESAGDLGPEEMVYAIGTLTFLVYPTHNTGAWSEVIASSSLKSKRYADVRGDLSAYYSAVLGWIDVEADFEERRDPIEDFVLGFMRPEAVGWLIERFLEGHAAAIGLSGDVSPTAPLVEAPTQQLADSVATYLQGHREELEAALVNVVAIAQLRLELYTVQLALCTALLAELRGFPTGAS